MSETQPLILVTGASGKLGRLVLADLLEQVPAARVRAMARHPEALADVAALGVDVHAADYDRPETLDAAFSGAERILLISGNDVGRREAQHRNVVAAAERAGAEFVAYTSVLHADTTRMKLADEHRVTERTLQASGITYALLRNGLYLENDAASIPAMLASGRYSGASGNGRLSSAARADYARAAVAVLVASNDRRSRIYELGGDTSFTKAELAAEVSRQSGTNVVYQNLDAAGYARVLEAHGIPAETAAIYADIDVQAARGALFDDSHTLSKLIGKPTTTLEAAVARALADARAIPT